MRSAPNFSRRNEIPFFTSRLNHAHFFLLPIVKTGGRPQRLPARDLRSPMALARSPQKRAQTLAPVRLPVRPETGQRVRQPVPLPAGHLARLRSHRSHADGPTLRRPIPLAAVSAIVFIIGQHALRPIIAQNRASTSAAAATATTTAIFIVHARPHPRPSANKARGRAYAHALDSDSV